MRYPAANARSQNRYNRAFVYLQPGESYGAVNVLAVRTQKEVAMILGVSRQAVQVIERRALSKLRRLLRRFREDL
jgi:hypothetical protein